MNGYENKKSNEKLYNLDMFQEKEASGNEVSGGKFIRGGEGGEIGRVDHGVGMIIRRNVRLHALIS